MKQLSEQQLRTHIPVAGWLLIANSLLGLVGSLFLFTLMVSAGSLFADLGPATNDAEATRIFTLMTTYTTFLAALISGLWVLVSIPGLIAGAGMLARQSWGRVLGIVVSVLTLLNFPIGTLIGGYALFLLFQDAASTYFGSRPRGLNASPQPA